MDVQHDNKIRIIYQPAIDQFMLIRDDRIENDTFPSDQFLTLVGVMVSMKYKKENITLEGFDTPEFNSIRFFSEFDDAVEHEHDDDDMLEHFFANNIPGQ